MLDPLNIYCLMQSPQQHCFEADNCVPTLLIEECTLGVGELLKVMQHAWLGQGLCRLLNFSVFSLRQFRAC